MSTTTFRNDGLDSPISPNGPHPLYYVVDAKTERRHGPYSCPREAELAMKNEDDEIVDHRGNVHTPSGQ